MAAEPKLDKEVRIGDRTVDQNGQYWEYHGAGAGPDGDGWERIAVPRGHAPGSPTRALTPQEETDLKERGVQVESARRLDTQNRAALAASDRLNSGPYRGMLLNMGIPDPNDSGFWDKFGAATVGTIGNLTGAIGPRDVEDYQTVKRAENQAVLDKQLAQKGTQTNVDAARMAMTGLSTSNSPRQNRTVAVADAAAAAYAAAKAQFATQWAGTYGLYGADEYGRDMTTAFMQTYKPPPPPPDLAPVVRRPERQYTPQNQEGVTITRIK